MPAYGQQGKWPDLSKPGPAVGGGERDVALVVGIEKYAFVSDVPGAAENVRDWYMWLVRGLEMRPTNARLLLDSEATREEILYMAKELGDRASRRGRGLGEYGHLLTDIE